MAISLIGVLMFIGLILWIINLLPIELGHFTDQVSVLQKRRIDG